MMKNTLKAAKSKRRRYARSLRQQPLARAFRLLFEELEPRALLAVASLTGGNLEIVEADDPEDNQLTLQVIDEFLSIQDASNPIVADGGVVQTTPNEVRVALADLTGNVEIHLGFGDDRLDIDLTDAFSVAQFNATVFFGEVTVSEELSLGSDESQINADVITVDGLIDVIGGDLTLVGNEINVTGTVSTTAGEMEIDGGEIFIAGQLASAGGEINVDGGDVSIAGEITSDGGKIEVDGGDVIIEASARIDSTRPFDPMDDAPGGEVTLDGSDLIVRGDVFTGGGPLNIDGSSTVEADDDGLILSTRRIAGGDHRDDVSIGDSGPILFDGNSISVGVSETFMGTVHVYAHVETGSSFAAGDVSFNSTEASGFDVNGVPAIDFLADVDNTSVDIQVDRARILGREVSFDARADNSRIIFEDVSLNGGQAVLETLVGLPETFSVIGGVAVSISDASIEIGVDAAIEAETFRAIAEATSSAQTAPISKVLGVAVAIADSDAEVTIDGSVVTTGDAYVRAGVDNLLDARADASNIVVNATAAFAVTVLDSNSKAHLSETSNFDVGGNLVVRADTLDRNVTMARSTGGEDGAIGVAAAVSDERGSTDALVDGTIEVGGDLTIDARQEKQAIQAGRLFAQVPSLFNGVAALAGVNTDSTGTLLDDVQGEIIGSPIAVLKAIPGRLSGLAGAAGAGGPGDGGKLSKLTGPLMKVAGGLKEKFEQLQEFMKKFDAAASVAVVHDVNDVTARIGSDEASNNADVDATGAITVTAVHQQSPRRHGRLRHRTATDVQ